MNKEQYVLVCARRQSFDNLIWQTPPLAMAAQAFLLAAALDPDYARLNALALSCFSLVVGLASIHLMIKHRYHEREDCTMLVEFERKHVGDGYSVVHGRQEAAVGAKKPLFARVSAFRVWLVVLGGFCALASYAALSAAQRPSTPEKPERPIVIGGLLIAPTSRPTA